MEIRIENIDFTYKGGEKVLSNVNLLAKSGNIVAIVNVFRRGKNNYNANNFRTYKSTIRKKCYEG